jgi:hypothetical protein
MIGKQHSGKSAEASLRVVASSVHRWSEETEKNEGADYLIFQQKFESRACRNYTIDRNVLMDNIEINIKKIVLTVICCAQL